MVAAEVSGYVLAGGKSSRMGRDKALLELAGRPLVQHAAEKLRLVCADVHILSGNEQLAAFGPLVADVHPGCGPLGGIEAALLHLRSTWSLILPVDVPFVTADFLAGWVAEIVATSAARVAMFTVDGRPQPTLCLLHQEVTPFVQRAVERGEFKLFPMLEEAGRMLAEAQSKRADEVFLNRSWNDGSMFANLNTPEEFAEAERQWAAVNAS
ncbi:molybdenum cofactor guanylyltransferase [Granulicella arctica]|uniref:Probable molybdenum cofactor guanylyltransferase n=1 Tax=Granulicella arctica TaxID=940613 RepID=A0A7Y9TGT6_9BACT|nr:molybdenum cofactor guanylyltransferase [Granulicella arctica]NYF80291.1 molybdopterin-guanine dinucleotide biosynthesis protein A [Granulicella arctica]